MFHSQPLPNQPDLRKIGLHPNFWYPLARAKDLKKGKTLSVSYGGDRIVLVRTASGKVFALEDRCAHRQMPLSEGVVCGEKLQCCYHAWRYNDEGKVAGIPYLPKGANPPKGVRSYPSREAYGLIFVFPGDPGKSQEVPFPQIPPWASSDHQTMYFSREINCHYSFMHENLMDMNHQFLHRKLMGRIKPTLIGTQKGEDWLEVKYKFEFMGGKRHRGGSFMVGPKPKNSKMGNHEIMTIRTQYPYQMLNVRKPSSPAPSFYMWAVYVPVDKEQRIHHSFGMLMIRKPKIPGLIYLLWPFMRYFTESVFAEDRMAVEAEQRAYDEQGGDWNREIFPLVLDLRKLLIQNGLPLSLSQRPFEQRYSA